MHASCCILHNIGVAAENILEEEMVEIPDCGDGGGPRLWRWWRSQTVEMTRATIFTFQMQSCSPGCLKKTKIQNMNVYIVYSRKDGLIRCVYRCFCYVLFLVLNLNCIYQSILSFQCHCLLLLLVHSNLKTMIVNNCVYIQMNFVVLFFF